MSAASRDHETKPAPALAVEGAIAIRRRTCATFENSEWTTAAADVAAVAKLARGRLRPHRAVEP